MSKYHIISHKYLKLLINLKILKSKLQEAVIIGLILQDTEIKDLVKDNKTS